MAGVVAMLAVSLILSAVAFQAWIDVLRRDNEAEMIFRAQEIVRAIQRYRRDHGGQGPRTLKDLLEPSPKRSYYIRKEYEDPLVKGGKWGLLYMGPGGTIVDPSDPMQGGPGLQGQQQIGGHSGTSLDHALSQTQRDAGDSKSQRGLNANAPAGAGRLGGIGNRDTGEEGIGLPIAGVKSLCEETPFRVYKGETEYKKWLFTYLDISGPGGGPAQKGKNKGPGFAERLKAGGGQVQGNPGGAINQDRR